MTGTDLLRPPVLKELCARAGMRPDRTSGQNFLINRATLERIVAAVDPQPSDTILEVGAGFGVLTVALAERLIADVPPLRVRGGEGELRAVRNPSQPSTRTSSVLDRPPLTLRGGAQTVPPLGIRGGEGELRAVRNPSQPPLTLRGGDAGRIIAIERDRRITPILRELVMSYDNVEVVEGDILRMLRAAVRGGSRAAEQQGSRVAEPSQLQQGVAALQLCCAAAGWKLAANLPYSITSDFLRLLFDAVGTGALPPPERAVLLLQREVVDRMCADPSRHSEHRNVGLLTILTQLHCVSRRIARVPAAHFWPAPKVESAVVVLEHWRTPSEIETLLGGERPPPHAPPPRRGRKKRDDFFRLVRSCFAHRRRQLHHLLKSHASRLTPHDSCIRLVGIDPTARPEELTFAQWVALVRAVYK